MGGRSRRLASALARTGQELVLWPRRLRSIPLLAYSISCVLIGIGIGVRFLLGEALAGAPFFPDLPGSRHRYASRRTWAGPAGDGPWRRLRLALPVPRARFLGRRYRPPPGTAHNVCAARGLRLPVDRLADQERRAERGACGAQRAPHEGAAASRQEPRPTRFLAVERSSRACRCRRAAGALGCFSSRTGGRLALPEHVHPGASRWTSSSTCNTSARRRSKALPPPTAR